MSPRSSFRLGHRPFLDGIRGIAIILVMLFHTRDPILPGGHIGVNIFFVLSGFLITSILVEEWSRSRRIDFRRFYLRRGLRLLPGLFALVVAVVAIKTAADQVGISYWEDERSIWWSAAAAIFYFANWVKAFNLYELGALTHTWSLSIEEQFYLIWPVALLLMLRAGWRFVSMIYALICAAIGSALLRLYLFDRDGFERAYDGLDTRADALLCGCILSLAMSAGLVPHSLVGRWIVSIAAAASAAFVAVACVTGGEYDGWLYYRGGLLLTAIGTAVVMYRYLIEPTGVGNAILSSRVLSGFGLISYGLYLWHMPVYWVVEKMALPTVADVPLRISLSLVTAVISYYLIELPFLRLKELRPLQRATSRRAALGVN
jgi:peptidoglycan/LPS O-acetylase OafA/YrhL